MSNCGILLLSARVHKYNIMTSLNMRKKGVFIMMKKDNTSSLMRKVATPVGDFTIFFPCGVYNSEDKLNDIPKVVESIDWEVPHPNPLLSREAQKRHDNQIHDRNAVRLQEALNTAVKFGTNCASFGVRLLYLQREIIII